MDIALDSHHSAVEEHSGILQKLASAMADGLNWLVFTSMDHTKLNRLPPEQQRAIKESVLWQAERAGGLDATGCIVHLLRTTDGDCYTLIREGYRPSVANAATLGALAVELWSPTIR